MKIFKLFGRGKPDEAEQWGEALAELYENELKDNEEQWETREDEDGNIIAHQIK